MESSTEIEARLAFLQHPLVSSLLATHPNRVFNSTTPFVVPLEWEKWLEWASLPEEDIHASHWKTVLKAYTSTPAGDRRDDATEILPHELSELAAKTRSLELDRTPLAMPLASSRRANLPGMSPKKSHEVLRMTNYILGLTASTAFKEVKHIVDIGAGQGYLSRALARAGFHVLALDGDASQTEGAERRDSNSTKSYCHVELPDSLPNSPGRGQGSLTHVTNLITPASLNSSVSSWINRSVSEPGCTTPIPVLFVALHACGTLTPDIFRTFLSHHTSTNHEGCRIPPWTPMGTVIIGCCYNLMSSDDDFPLSKAYARFPSLASSHLQLAAQVPSIWPNSPLSTDISIRKVAYRALIEQFIPASTASNYAIGASVGAPLGSRNRLGRLPDSAYASFPVFLDRASTRLGFQLPSSLLVDGSSKSGFAAAPSTDPGNPWFKSSRQQLEVLHVLRCMLGPAIESTIILDRLAWLREALGAGHVGGAGEDGRWEVDLVGLFDQAAGSARNFAITIRPSTTTSISPA